MEEEWGKTEKKCWFNSSADEESERRSSWGEVASHAVIFKTLTSKCEKREGR